MRKRIRLTGRRQLPKSCVQLKVLDVGDSKRLALDIVNKAPLKGFPRDARIKVKLNENKVSETIEFGTLGAPQISGPLKNQMFSAPSCQLRIVSPDGEKKGLLLGSTEPWNLTADNQNKKNQDQDSILLFQPGDVAPRIWKLDIRNDDFPVVYVDKRIPDPRGWAKNDPVFVSAVLPAIIQQIFSEIFSQNDPAEIPWMDKWIQWAELLMPGGKVPVSDDNNAQEAWLDGLLDTFCLKHKMHESLLNHILQEQTQ